VGVTQDSCSIKGLNECQLFSSVCRLTVNCEESDCSLVNCHIVCCFGAWGSVVVGRSRERLPEVSLVIFTVAPDGTMCPGVDSAPKSEYQGFLVG